jgi:elongation factor G
MLFEPIKGIGSDFVFENKVVGGNIPREYIPAVEKGIQGVSKTGVLAGYQFIDFKVTLLDGAYHDVDSSALAFELAAKAAFREGVRKAHPVLLEPIMSVEVISPDDYTGDIIGHLSSIRGKIIGMNQKNKVQIIQAKAPLSSMFGYVNTLRSMTQGRAQYSMQFESYATVPDEVSEKIINNK